jgi:DNA-binding NarL/FixJ family response regulator
MIKIIIADDHQMFIDGLKSLLEHIRNVKVAGEANNGLAVLNLLDEKQADIVLLDISMPVMDGIETMKEIHKKHPNVKVIMLSMYNRPEFISTLVAEGAAGFILKNTGKEELKEAIETVAAGGTFYSNEVTAQIMESLRKTGSADRSYEVNLSSREKEILRLIADEFTTGEIAKKLFLSTHTIETHRKNMLSKLNVRNSAGLIRYAVEHGLI